MIILIHERQVTLMKNKAIKQIENILKIDKMKLKILKI